MKETAYINEAIILLDKMKKKIILKSLKGLLEMKPSRPLLIWGAGSTGANAGALLREVGVAVTGFIDSSPAKWGSAIAGYKIYSPSVLEGESFKARPFVIIASLFAGEIGQQLEETGYRRGRDYLPDVYSGYELEVGAEDGI